jgi:adenosylcobinamide-phosphate guanylyltransferase
MLALIMGGGEGTRLDLGEKPLVTVQGTPMISRVIEAFEQGGYEVVVALTPRTPFTANWCRVHGIPHVITRGTGYIADLVEAVCELEEQNPLFTSVSDLPCLRSSTLHHLHTLYHSSGKPACSAWVPASLLKDRGISYRYMESVEGVDSVPAGINILLGKQIQEEQEELRCLLPLPDLAVHVNTRSDLEIARTLCQKISMA